MFSINSFSEIKAVNTLSVNCFSVSVNTREVVVGLLGTFKANVEITYFRVRFEMQG